MRRRAPGWAPAIMLVGGIAVSVLPLLWFTWCAFKGRSDITAYPPRLIVEPTLTNFRALIRDHEVKNTFLNGLMAATGCTVLTLGLGIPLARVVLRSSAHWRQRILLSLLSTRLIPPIAVSLPMFIVFSKLGIRGELWGLVIADSIAVLPLTVWLLSLFTLEVPTELQWSGQLDGLSSEGSFWRVVLPAAAPGVAVAGTFAFIFAWNDYLIATLLTDADTMTLTASLPVLVTQGVTQWGQIAGATLLGVAPAVGLAAVLGRYFVAGITTGVVKKL